MPVIPASTPENERMTEGNFEFFTIGKTNCSKISKIDVERTGISIGEQQEWIEFGSLIPIRNAKCP
jgi:hypothetical protein